MPFNTAIEELVRQRFELPAFSALMRAARTARATVNRGFYRRIADASGDAAKLRFAALFTKQAGERRTGWDRVKSEPGQPTVKRIKKFVVHLEWLDQQAGEGDPLAGIPVVKVNRFAAEGRALNAARMSLVTVNKRYAVAAALVFEQRARAYDDAAEMFIRQIWKMDNRAREALEVQQSESAERSTGLVRTLRDVALAYGSEGSDGDRLRAIGSLIEPGVDLVYRCEEYIAAATRNHLHLLPQFFLIPEPRCYCYWKNCPGLRPHKTRALKKPSGLC